MCRGSSIVILFCSLVLFSNCDAKKLRIVDGVRVDSIKDYPFQASLHYGLFGHLCGASIINKRYLLTAGHCVHAYGDEGPLDPEVAEVVVGTRVLSAPAAQRYGVEEFKLHPEFKTLEYKPYYADLALVKLKEDLEFNEKVQPAKLPEADHEVEDKSTVTLIGWGYTTFNANDSENFLRYTKMQVYDNQKCRDEWRASLNEYESDIRLLIMVTKEMICMKGGGNFCDGDSGGPVIDRDHVQIGVMSFNDDCGSQLPSIATDLRVWRSWIIDASKIE
ncbi:hypothetical protein TKK_0000478 [Trichogramma kaykai]|uniref:Peptidase S1 domain-containing protein n=1 Tax=Trichogramma kaykai TaxID=54128 RepID=A0ABD2WJT9_9HYME